MATRLYVNTKDPLTLDMLADVPRGTFIKWQQIQNLPDSIWDKVEVRKRLMDAIAKDPDCSQWYSFALAEYAAHGVDERLDKPTLEEALKAETTFCGTPYVPHMFKDLWMRIVCSADLKKMDSFLSEGFGRIAMDESALVRFTRNEHGASHGSTRLFTQVAAILRKQADDNRLIFNAEDWTIQSLTYTGESYITFDRGDISNTSLWRRGPRVKIAKLEGLSWS